MSNLHEGLLQSWIQKISTDMFNDTQLEIFNLMERDSFQRFKQSPAYNALKKSLDSRGMLLVKLQEENMI